MTSPFQIYYYKGSATAPGKIPEPHRHDFQEIIFVEQGAATHQIDGEEYVVRAPTIVLVAQGKMHKFIPHANAGMHVVRFTNEFIDTSGMELFCQFSQLSKIPVKSTGLRKKLSGLLEMMENDHRSAHPNTELQRHLLAAYIAVLKEERQRFLLKDHPDKGSNYQLFNEFIGLLELNYKVQQSVKLYADTLNVTTKKLGAVCKEIFGESPSRIVEQRVMLEAKRLLIYSNETVQEIAFGLGYGDHSYFTKAFRKNEGMTPTEFRERKRAA